MGDWSNKGTGLFKFALSYVVRCCGGGNVEFIHDLNRSVLQNDMPF